MTLRKILLKAAHEKMGVIRIYRRSNKSSAGAMDLDVRTNPMIPLVWLLADDWVLIGEMNDRPKFGIDHECNPPLGPWGKP
mgnify:CR=1 FL=1